MQEHPGNTSSVPGFICTLLRLSMEVKLFSLSCAPPPLGFILLLCIPQPSFCSYFLQSSPLLPAGGRGTTKPAQGHEPGHMVLHGTWSRGWPLPDVGFGAIPSILGVQSPVCLLAPAFPALPLLMILQVLAMNCLTSFLRG